MKKFLLALVMLGVFQSAYAQDSIQVSFSQEVDTLVKQRFIDRYENLFMTKVPTRQMFKVSAIGSEVQGAGFNFAYEYKVSPSFSVEGAVYTQLSRENSGLANELFYFHPQQVNIWANLKARWYYNMSKRIRNGLNANNFSGAYLGASYEQSLYIQDYTSGKHAARVGFLYGFQSRFFNHGLVDFAAGLYQRGLGQFSDFHASKTFIAVENFVLGTHFNIGLAIGDWKKIKTSPLCDVLFCDELVRSQWKVQAPNVVLGFRDQVFRSEVAYELAIGKTPLSVQADAGIQFFRQKFPNGLPIASHSSATANLSLRYYPLRNYQARHGKGGGNFSGPYASLVAGYNRINFRSSSKLFPEQDYDQSSNDFSVSAALGFQQRLFKKLYIDVSLYNIKPLSPAARPYFNGNWLYFSSKMSVGFTF